jgi:hypothetical protein
MNTLAIVAMMIVGLLTGAAVGLGVNIMTGAIAAAIVGAFSLLLPSRHLAAVLFVMTFLVQGTVKYFADTNALAWATSGLAMVLLLRVILDSFDSSLDHKANQRSRHMAPAMAFLATYFLVFFVSLLANQPALPQVLSSIRNALPMVSILLAAYWLSWSPQQLTSLWTFIAVTAVLQLPLVMYQHFFIAAERSSQGWDAVVGTMGGSRDGGGMNSILVIYCLAGLSFVLARVRRNLASWKLGWATALIVFAVIALGEVKAAFVWMAMVLVFFYGNEIFRRPGRAIIYVVLGAVLFSSLIYVYEALYWQDQKLEQRTIASKIEKMSGYFFDPSNVNYRTGEVSRGASIALWVNDEKSNVLHRAIGFGPGASKSVGTLGQGEVAIRYSPLHIDATTSAVILWDTGIAGLVTYLAALLALLWSGWRLRSRMVLGGAEASLLDTGLITLAIMMTLLIYNKTLIDEPTAQMLLFFSAGTILRMQKIAHQKVPVPARHGSGSRPPSGQFQSRSKQRYT